MISVRLLILKITKISNALLNTLFLSKLKDDRLLHTARFARALRYAALTPKLVGKGWFLMFEKQAVLNHSALF